jgi:ABC-2 type transport system ATP-binding protein
MAVERYLHFVARLKGIAHAERQVGEAVESCGLGQVTRRLVGKLSKGYRQRVGLAQALLGEPEVLILDEPTSGLDPEQVTDIRSLIASFRGERTILLSSHILSEVSLLCEQVIVINRGKVLARDSPANLAERLRPSLRVRMRVEAPREEVLDVIRAVPGVLYADKDPRDLSVRFEARDDETLREISRAIQDRRWLLLEMNHEAVSLEDIFLALVRRSSGDESAPPGGEAA